MTLILELDGLVHRLCDKERPEEFVVRVDKPLAIHSGDFVALLGPSGCGKTTLLTVLGLLRAPTEATQLSRFAFYVREEGRVREIDLKEAWVRGRQRRIETVRRRFMGFALQSGELLPALTVRENIEAPLCLNGWRSGARRERVDSLIDAFRLCRAKPADQADTAEKKTGVYNLGSARVNRLSGGEYQRVSLARAIAHKPQLIFVDEPTAALNRELARSALNQLRIMLTEDEKHSAAVMITHDEELATEFANVVIRMEPSRNEIGGRVVEVTRKGSHTSAHSSQSLVADRSDA